MNLDQMERQIKTIYLNIKKKIALTVVFFLVFFSAAAQSTFTKLQNQKLPSKNQIIEIEWGKVGVEIGFDDKPIVFLNSSQTINDPGNYWLPFYQTKLKLPLNTAAFTAELTNTIYEPLTAEEKNALKDLPDEAISGTVNVTNYITTIKKQPYASIAFTPLRRGSDGNIEKIKSFKINLTDVVPASASGKTGKRSFKVRSVLASGEWYKIGLVREGIYKVNYAMLQDMGFNMNNLQSVQLRLFGNGGGALPVENSEDRIDDLAENNIEMHDGGDGSFDPGDYFLFYGQNQTRWLHDEDEDEFIHEPNPYSDSTFYFITRDYNIGAPKRVEEKANLQTNADLALNNFVDWQYHEEDRENLIKSGKRWYGEIFSVRRSYTFPFSFPDIVTSEPFQVTVAAASRAIRRPSSFTISVNGSDQNNKIAFTRGVTAGYANTYALYDHAVNFTQSASDNVNVQVSYDNTSSADIGWLDYIRVAATRQLRFTGSQMTFRNPAAKNANVVQYNAAGVGQNAVIWDVTDPTRALIQQGNRSGNNFSFKTEGGDMREYIIFNPTVTRTPAFSKKVNNQNLHAFPQTDYLIISHKPFRSAADQLARFHEERGEFSVRVVNINEVYNEFSSGAPDLTAIKDFMKMFYDRAGSDASKLPKYLLLFGGASYDYKDRISGNTNHIPIYQSANSESPTGSFMSDDYVGFLDDDEGDDVRSGLDIGVGRIPVNTNSQAQSVVNKIIRYHRIPQSFGSWRNRITWVADDLDHALSQKLPIHMRDADKLAEKIKERYPSYNNNKIYFDAFKKESTAGGQRYPGVTDEINKSMVNGTLLMTYVGHGGVSGWAHERVLRIQDINSWTNRNSMPLFLTATCEFTRFDDPERTSAGEFVLINPDGGGIGLMTTTRLVYASPNYQLANTFTDYVFEAVDGQTPTLGDLLMLSKDISLNNITISNGINYRNFTLLGDPAMRLAYPQYTVKTTQAPDTIQALEKVTIKGIVTNDYGQKQENYNGIVYPVIYDQLRQITTLDNDNEGAFQYDDRTGIIFNGKAGVKNGEFEFSFVVPKDINYEFGKAKVSYYTDDRRIDGNGNDLEITIGGIDENAAEDNTPPDVQLWMNDENFVSGGITDENPSLYARVFDESGINTVGSGIGHDITAVLDENTGNPIILNDFYESDLNSYQSGTINYPFSELNQGRHTLSLKVWDVYNNSAEAYTEFVVAGSEELAIEHLLNYPNPFTTNTSFYFEHNAPGQSLEVRIQVFTVSGKLVKTIDGIYASDGFRIGPINWNGRDDYGDAIGKGVYVYKVKVTAQTGESVDKFEKLVILN